MRRTARFYAALVATLFALTLCADTGISPRMRSSDYPVHQSAKGVTVGAALVPPDQVSKIFSRAISNQYAVVEVGIYPDDGGTFNVDLLNFTLRVEGRVSRAEKPRDVAPWKDQPASGSNGPLGNGPVNVGTETGVIYQRSNDPVYGKRSGVGTYSGVEVDNYPRPSNSPPSSSSQDPKVQDRLMDMALPEGDISKRVAGYLYFPQTAKRKKNDSIDLDYSKDDVSMRFAFPKQ